MLTKILAVWVATVASQDLFLASVPPKASVADLRRARSRIHSGRVAGTSAQEIASKINSELERQHLALLPCSNFSLGGLNSLVRRMWPLLSEDLHSIYSLDSTDRRKRRFSTLHEYERRWAEETALAEASFDDAASLLDGKCAEVIMLWAHHLPSTARQAFQDVVWPLVPAYQADRTHSRAAREIYSETVVCTSGHNMTENSTSDHEWPHWPEELHYRGMGHGPYPFWLNPDPRDADAVAEMAAWYSEKQHAEKFYHASCTSDGLGKGVPCYHLMIGTQPSPQAFLYSANLSYCCISQPPGPQSFFVKHLSPMQSDFIEQFTYAGEESFSGFFYNGTVKRYTLQQGLEPFWFLTTPAGLPVQQGEGANITHDYDLNSLDAGAIDPSIFTIPAACAALDPATVPLENQCYFHR